ncbi:hypothetical protein [Desertibacillus haloalkaliphilus]|uniref:hypothetical protein n=1 Tax=Desertibacillus haloalkaliphilus TaxID=1328930 RepID=UPI001C274D88|nr:hypothetical protein [Desertibacillus haloalkaliphilus]MBU8908109.1 hypothetical protein [Desertibacillus haloalkaliphilus]
MFYFFLGYWLGSSDDNNNGGGCLFPFFMVGLIGVVFQVIFAVNRWFDQLAEDKGIFSFLFSPYIIQQLLDSEGISILFISVAVNTISLIIINLLIKLSFGMEKNLVNIIGVVLVELYLCGLIFRQIVVGGSFLYGIDFTYVIMWYIAGFLSISITIGIMTGIHSDNFKRAKAHNH